MDINTENNKFSSSKKTKKRLNIQEENLMFPPIQTVFELPPMKTKDPIIEPLKPLSVKKQEKKDKLKNILQQPTVIHEGTKEGTKEGMKEGMSESGQKFKQTPAAVKFRCRPLPSALPQSRRQKSINIDNKTGRPANRKPSW